MAHEFTSGVFAHGKSAWHGLGDVIEGTLPADEMFRRAGALFPVEKIGLYAGNPNDPDSMIALDEMRTGIWRPDTREILGTAGPNYQIIANQRLLDFASALREEVEMDTVVVLRKGAKVAFTARIRGTQQEVLPGDKLHRNIVGYLGHDGKTAFGGLFSDTRVVCANTLAIAQQDGARSGKQFQIRHSENDIAQIDAVISGIDMARQTFPAVLDDYRTMAATPMDTGAFRAFLESVYQVPAVVTGPGGASRAGSIEDMPRKWAQLARAWNYGLGTDIPGVKGTVYGALNAVTEVESSTLTEGAGKRRLHSALFGTGAAVIKRANEEARALAGIA